MKRILCICCFSCSLCILNAQTDDYPYEFKLGLDLAIIPAGISMKMLSDVYQDQISIIDENDISQLDSSGINPIDRFATRCWSSTADNASDVFLNLLIYSPALLLIPEFMHISEHDRWKNIAQLGLMYTEVYFLTEGTTQLVQSLVKRKRPYLYNDELSMEKKLELAQDKGAYQSFFSGHTAGLFSSAVFLSTVMTDMYGLTPLTVATWITSLGMASAASGMRVAAGHHFPTDILAGAVAGGGIGFIVPFLHKKMSENPGEDMDIMLTGLTGISMSIKL